MKIILELKEFIISELYEGIQNDVDIKEDDNLLVQGIIDSSGIMKLVEFMENQYNINITNEDIIPENFASLNSLQSLIEHKQSEVK